ncbi:MAG: hypothetical protein H0W75_11730 [Chitinophagaceae bacterium]|nr:hypothetical protein [Chitinophagaceae bacterium]
MKINIVKKHSQYPLGIADVDEKRAEYLVRMGVAEMVDSGSDKPVERTRTKTDFIERVELKPPQKEKAKNKTGNVPTAKKRK